MLKSKILLVRMPFLFQKFLELHLQGESTLEVNDAVCGIPDLLLAVRGSGFDAVILPLPELADVGGVCSHLLSENPDLEVFAVPAGGPNFLHYRNDVVVTPNDLTPMDNLLRALRAVGKK